MYKLVGLSAPTSYPQGLPGKGPLPGSCSWPVGAQEVSPALAVTGKDLAALSLLQGRAQLPTWLLWCFWPTQGFSLSQRLLCWLCFSNSDSYLISTSELSASIPCCQPCCHRLWYKKEFWFLERGPPLQFSGWGSGQASTTAVNTCGTAAQPASG